MKRITLEIAPPIYADDRPLKWADVLLEVCRFPEGNGIDLVQMKKDLRLLDALHLANDDALELEDADWENLCNRLKTTKWRQVDSRVLAMCNAIFDAPDV